MLLMRAAQTEMPINPILILYIKCKSGTGFEPAHEQHLNKVMKENFADLIVFRKGCLESDPI